jgi:hypothetical protein
MRNPKDDVIQALPGLGSEEGKRSERPVEAPVSVWRGSVGVEEVKVRELAVWNGMVRRRWFG